MNFKQAKIAGAKRYDGSPCKHGHGTERYVAGRKCVECDRLNSAHRYHTDTIGLPSEMAKLVKGRRERRDERKAAIMAILTERNASIDELCKALRLPRITAWRYVKQLHSAKQIHIADFDVSPTRPAAIYAAGNDEDAVYHRRDAEFIRSYGREYRQRRRQTKEKQSEPAHAALHSALFGNTTIETTP